MLSELEELVLALVVELNRDAYGFSILARYHEKTGRELNINEIHSALHALEDKDLLSSQNGFATKERSGRRKRVYSLTQRGKEKLDELSFGGDR